MATNSKIAWCDDTRNFWWGCEKVSEACQFCYAEAMDRRRGPFFDHGNTHWGVNAPRWLRVDAALKECEASVRLAKKEGRRRRVFVNSMSDTFEDHPMLKHPRNVALKYFESRPECDWLLLTKRPENIREMVPMTWLCGEWPAHVWIGTTAENQARYIERVEHLCAVPAAVRFLSCEPLLGPIGLNFSREITREVFTRPKGQTTTIRRLSDFIQWVIIGGESGATCRKLDVSLVEALVAQCRAAGVAPFVKQLGARPFSWGEPHAEARAFKNQNMEIPPRWEWIWHLKDRMGGDWDEWPEALRVREFPRTPTAAETSTATP